MYAITVPLGRRSFEEQLGRRIALEIQMENITRLRGVNEVSPIGGSVRKACSLGDYAERLFAPHVEFRNLKTRGAEVEIPPIWGPRCRSGPRFDVERETTSLAGVDFV